MGRAKTFKQVDFNYEEIKKEISNSSKTTAIYIGADSVRKRRTVTYCTVIVIHYDGKHGAKIFKDIKVQRNFEKSPKALRMRLMTEVGYAAQAAGEIIECVGERPFEIHLDINPNPKYNSSVVVKEAVGYILGTFGIEPKLKPDSFCASFASDKYANEAAKRNEQAADNTENFRKVV